MNLQSEIRIARHELDVINAETRFLTSLPRSGLPSGEILSAARTLVSQIEGRLTLLNHRVTLIEILAGLGPIPTYPAETNRQVVARLQQEAAWREMQSKWPFNIMNDIMHRRRN
jgi:hypothetical protein